MAEVGAEENVRPHLTGQPAGPHVDGPLDCLPSVGQVCPGVGAMGLRGRLSRPLSRAPELREALGLSWNGLIVAGVEALDVEGEKSEAIRPVFGHREWMTTPAHPAAQCVPYSLH